jgi:hypothetical protein
MKDLVLKLIEDQAKYYFYFFSWGYYFFSAGALSYKKISGKLTDGSSIRIFAYA